MRHKMMAAPLAPNLVSKGAKALPVRKGDTVRIMRGDHIGFEGKVNRVDLKNYRIFLEGLTREKVDGTNIFVPVHPSKVMIKNLKLDDKWRQAILEHKKQLAQPKKEKKEKKIAKAAEKPAKKARRAVKAKKEKPAAKKAEVQEEPAEKAPAAAKKKVQRKPVAKKKAEEKPAKKEEKPKTTKTATAKKPRAKRKAASKTKGGT
jgi:large subunit ribosomal protein L24